MQTHVVDERTIIQAFRTQPRAMTPCTPASGPTQEQGRCLERLLVTWPDPTPWERVVAAAKAGWGTVHRVPGEVTRAFHGGWRPVTPPSRLVVQWRRTRRSLASRIAP